jgi:hypothetical protein
MWNFLTCAIVAMWGCIAAATAQTQAGAAPETAGLGRFVISDRMFYYAGHIRKIAAGPDGSILASSSSAGRCWLLKLDAKGAVIWEKFFLREDNCVAAAQPDGGIILGSGISPSSYGLLNSGEFVIRKLDKSGQILLDKRFSPQSEVYSGQHALYLEEIELQQNGNIIAVAALHGHETYRLLRMDRDGSVLQDQTFGKTRDTITARRRAAGLALLPDGSFAIAGNAGKNSYGWLMRFGADGGFALGSHVGGRDRFQKHRGHR